MMVLGLVFGAIIGALILVAWFRWRKMVNAEAEMYAVKDAKAAGPRGESLEAFISAYRRGETSVKPPAAQAAAAPGPIASASAPATAAASVASLAATRAADSIARREAFLSGAAKLVYLACKSGLRDHHCFAHVRLQSLCAGQLDASLQSAAVEILVCNASMGMVAAIDIAYAEPDAPDAAKAECLRTLGIRYLRLSPTSLPKPGDLKALLYRM